MPLSGRCLEILTAAQAVSSEAEFVFRMHRVMAHLSNMVFLAVPGRAPGAGQISAAICRIEMTTLRDSGAGE